MRRIQLSETVIPLRLRSEVIGETTTDANAEQIFV